ncbi:hypothetical protein IAD21_05838 [Abditibacteriota bacterium]|nr:hypothetical protein IAD21_05838 [Abditibacteriota bacterium]
MGGAQLPVASASGLLELIDSKCLNVARTGGVFLYSVVYQ